MNKHYIPWGEIEALVNNLSLKISNSKTKYKNIFGLQRGGLIPAVMISHQLGIPMAKGDIGPTTLIIDDICDSGETLDKLVKDYQTLYAFPFNLNTAVLHYKPHTSSLTPTFYSKKLYDDDWIVYPWEKQDSKPIQDYKIQFGSQQKY